MLRRMLAATALAGALTLGSSGVFACGQVIKDLEAAIPPAALTEQMEAEAKSLIKKADELCRQGKSEEAKPLIDQAFLLVNAG